MQFHQQRNSLNIIPCTVPIKSIIERNQPYDLRKFTHTKKLETEHQIGIHNGNNFFFQIGATATCVNLTVLMQIDSTNAN